MADSKDGSSTAKSQKFLWEDKDIERFIDFCEARPCLWDIADPTYSKRHVRENALSEIKEELGIEINTIKSKWNSLRAQYGRELAKESNTKSGQSTDDVCESSWSYMEKILFVEQVKKTARIISTLIFQTHNQSSKKRASRMMTRKNDSLNYDSNRSLVEKSAKRKRANPTEQKKKLMEKCIDVLDRPMEAGDPFALHLSEQLKNLDERWRLLAEKRINDILFELRFEEFGASGGWIHFNQHFAHSQPIQSMHNVPVQPSSSYENRVPQQQPQPGTYGTRIFKHFIWYFEFYVFV